MHTPTLSLLIQLFSHTRRLSCCSFVIAIVSKPFVITGNIHICFDSFVSHISHHFLIYPSTCLYFPSYFNFISFILYYHFNKSIWNLKLSSAELHPLKHWCLSILFLSTLLIIINNNVFLIPIWVPKGTFWPVTSFFSRLICYRPTSCSSNTLAQWFSILFFGGLLSSNKHHFA